MSRRQTLVMLLVLVCYLFLASVFQNYGHDWGGDFSLYLNQAAHLFTEQMDTLLEDTRLTHELSTTSVTPTCYPWGWPLLLVPMVKTAGINYPWLKTYTSLFFAGFLLGSFRLFAPRVGPASAFLIVLCLLFDPPFLWFADNVLAEFAYLCFLIWSLVLIETISDDRPRWRAAVSASVLLAFAANIRTEGYLLLGVYAVSALVAATVVSSRSGAWHLASRGFWRVSLCTLLLLTLFVAFLPVCGGSHFGDFGLTTFATAQRNFSAFFGQLSLHLGLASPTLFAIVTLPFVGWGMIVRFKADHIMVLYALSVFLLFLGWPYFEGRYVFSFVPFFFYFLLAGLAELRMRAHVFGRPVSLANACLAGVVLAQTIQMLPYAYERLKSPRSVVEGPETASAREMFKFIRSETGADDVIVFFKPRVMNLYTGRRSFVVHDDERTVREKGDYLVLHKQAGTYNQLIGLAAGPPEWLAKRFENGKFVVYQIRRDHGWNSRY